MSIPATARAVRNELQRAAREAAYATPLEDFHPGAPRLFQNDTMWPYFERLRREAPVHYCANSPIEPYWSVTKYNDIMHVETNHGIFSSDASLGGISIRDAPQATISRASLRWISRATPPSAKPYRRCSRRRIWTNWPS